MTETISRNNKCLKTFFYKWKFPNYLFFHLIIWVCFPYVHLTGQIFILNKLFCLFILLWFLTIFLSILNFDGYYITRTDEGQPRPKYIFNKCGTNIYFFTLKRFGPSSSPKFKCNWLICNLCGITHGFYAHGY